MKKILLITAALFSISTAVATSYQPSASECSTVLASVIIKSVLVSFKEDTSFPNPPSSILLREGDTLTCPKIYAEIGANKTVIKSDKLEEMIGGLFNRVNISYHSYYTYPSIREGLNVYEIYTNYDGVVFGDYYYREVKEKAATSHHYGDYVSGYKLNGGSMTPLIYGGYIFPGPKLGDNDKLEIFSMPHRYNTWQKIVIDRKNKTLELYKTFEFPK